LGVLIQDVTRELAESFGMDKPHGALVAKVLPDSPAEKAGFEVGDVIVKFNNQNVSFSSDLPPLVGSSEIGARLPVEIMRRGKTKKLHVKIAELPTDDQIIAGDKNGGSSSGNALNVIVNNLTDEQREKLEIKENGVLVTNVTSGAAYTAGVRKGDVILLINNVKIRDVEHFEQLVTDLPKGKSIPILIQRRGGPIFLALKLTDDS
jgi:serine protease Do